MKDSDQKIDDLAQMVAGGFSELQRDISGLHHDMSEFRQNMTTKEDLIRLRGDMDIMLDRHIGTFRKDYDELAARVRKLEDMVLHR